MSLESTQESFWKLARGELAPPGERWALYRSMYFARQISALEDAFPRVSAALPEFREVAARYLMEFPSSAPMIERVGSRLPELLARERPALASLAALEWAEMECLLAEDAPIANLSAVRPESFGVARLRFVPALRRLDSAWDVLGDLSPRKTRVVVWRKGFGVRSAALEPDEAGALDLAMAGGAVAEACAALGTAERAFEAIRSWFASEMVSEVLA